MNKEFIELNRTFHEITDELADNDYLDFQILLGNTKRIGWSDLIKEYRVVLLSEAGSGKTYEICNIAKTLVINGEPAFFLRLENISRDFEDSFEVGSNSSFEEWIASSNEGWIFLDSVDEARLQDPRDFELALRKLSTKITSCIDRTHIVITSRIAAWRPITDLALIKKLFPFVTIEKSKNDKQFRENIFENESHTKTEPLNKAKSVVKLVGLDDLKKDQVKKFIKAKGIENSIEFLDAVERLDAWSFTTRPQDLEELVEYWIDRRQIGSRLEILKNSINRRLKERDQTRAQVHSLSEEDAGYGSRFLAAATTLIQNQSIRIPDGSENSKGIPIESILQEWDVKSQSTLLSRPIFDDAIYGAVRFHHRSVREYLTAEWFAELLKRKTSSRKIEGLFFKNQYGLNIITPNLRPILPWLALLNEQIQNRIYKLAPEVFFEGGDPSLLPLNLRLKILNDVCKSIADGITYQPRPGYEAAKLFAKPDLTLYIRRFLIKHQDNDDINAFLLNMVWIGQLTGVLTETMALAINPSKIWIVRIIAFKGIKVIGSIKDNEVLRQRFLSEGPGLNRDLLAELIADIEPTIKTIDWINSCLELSADEKVNSMDNLIDSLNRLVDIIDTELLLRLVLGLNRLLFLPPFIESRNCKVSKKFQSLIEPASKAVKRLIISRNPIALEENILSILIIIPAIRDYGSRILQDREVDFSEIVSEWEKLNRALFWYDVQRSRKTIKEKTGKRLSEFWQVSIFEPIWRFEISDFEYITNEISHQKLQDDKLVALTLAIYIYRKAKQPGGWSENLKILVSDNDELSRRLDTYLNRSVKSQESDRWKKQEVALNKKREEDRNKKEEFHTGWKNYFKENLERDRAIINKNPGSITESIHYLFNQAHELKGSINRWTQYNWKRLVQEYGEEVAHFYRDATVSFWRNYKPDLRSEGKVSNQTPFSVKIGLTGLEIEANETEDWLSVLNPLEVELACRYASYELNGFPVWLPLLFQIHQDFVSKFLLQEIKYELSVTTFKKDINYIIHDLSWSGQWAWNRIAPEILKLVKNEPKNIFILDKLLIIIQGSSLTNELIEKIASRKCHTLKKHNHLVRWYAVWTGVAPEPAINSLQEYINNIRDTKIQTRFAMLYVTNLLGDHRTEEVQVRDAFKSPKYLKSIYLLMHNYIRRDEDIDRTESGTYTPNLRDNAQEARNRLFGLLKEVRGKESYLAIKEIARLHPDETNRSWLTQVAKNKAEQDGDIGPWTSQKVKEFYKNLTIIPNDHKELAELAILRLLDLKDDLESGDGSNASILQRVKNESELRNYIGNILRENANNRFRIVPEEELADGKKVDLRFDGVKFDGPVPCELKIAENWTGPKLFERLENQLCGDYLRDNRSMRGIYILIFIGSGKKARWRNPSNNKLVDFQELTVALQEYWHEISASFLKVEDITVIGIDLTKRST
jgi:hypothetical protein